MATNKESSCNPMQKGKRRQKLHDNQNNVGNPKNKSQYENFNGSPVD